MRTGPIGPYDLGEPLDLPPVDERRAALPVGLLERLHALKAQLESRFGRRFLELRLFGSYARGDQTPDSDVDVLILFENMSREEQAKAVKIAYAESTSDVMFSPLVMSRERLDDLRARELLIALDLDAQGIPV